MISSSRRGIFVATSSTYCRSTEQPIHLRRSLHAFTQWDSPANAKIKFLTFYLKNALFVELVCIPSTKFHISPFFLKALLFFSLE